MRLPEPDEAAQRHSEKLIAEIRKQIEAAGGKIPFSQYMSMALYAPRLGYYSAGSRKFGAEGDFVTAPEISPLFSQCVARQCRQVLESLSAANKVVLEAGGGSGVMAAHMLAELERQEALPDTYYILEVSADLRERQKATLDQHVPHLLPRVQWLDSLPQEPFSGVVVANELLDAMPAHRFVIEDQQLRECYVTWREDRPAWRNGSPSTPRLAQRLGALAQQLPSGYVSEINLAMEGWLQSVARLLDQGMILLIDYGFPRQEYYHPQRSQGTLMCHYRHRSHPDPFVYPGLQDITTHVDFTAVAEAAAEAGLRVAGYNTQGFFLLAAGLADMAAQSDPNDLAGHLQTSQQIKVLTMPGEMGELFKVMALTRGIEVPLMGFELQDLRNRL